MPSLVGICCGLVASTTAVLGFYMSVCLCLATCVTLVTGLFISVVCPRRLKTGRQSEKKTLEAESHVKQVLCGVLRQTNTPRVGHLVGRSFAHRQWELKSVCGRHGTNRGRMFERKAYSQ